MQGIFITGTDTGIGKTYFTLACIKALQAEGIKTVAMKPVASGAELFDGELRNEDALQIQQALKSTTEYSLINPYAFAPPVSPHIAAARAGVEIDLDYIQHCYTKLCQGSDYVLVEGVGGWLAPLSDELSVADLACTIGLPVVLVVGIKLGCLNHAMLTVQSIRQTGLPLIGWVADCLEPQQESTAEQIAYLQQALQLPPLAVMGWQENATLSAEVLLGLSI